MCVCFVLLFGNGKREEKWEGEGGGGQGEDVWSIKYDNVHIQLRIIINLPVNPNITL